MNSFKEKTTTEKLIMIIISFIYGVGFVMGQMLAE
jgi:hypothetical protein